MSSNKLRATLHDLIETYSYKRVISQLASFANHDASVARKGENFVAAANFDGMADKLHRAASLAE